MTNRALEEADDTHMTAGYKADYKRLQYDIGDRRLAMVRFVSSDSYLSIQTSIISSVYVYNMECNLLCNLLRHMGVIWVGQDASCTKMYSQMTKLQTASDRAKQLSQPQPTNTRIQS